MTNRKGYNKNIHMAEIRGFFFDLDGTLVDTHDANYTAYAQAMKEVANEKAGSSLRDMIEAGESSRSFLTALLPPYKHDLIEEVNRRKGDIYPDHIEHSRLNVYLSAFLERMSHHATTVLVTTAKRKNGLAVLRYHNLERYFTHMVFGDDVSSMKPDPEAYVHGLSLAGIDADQALAFEDSDSGSEAAQRAGISVVRIRDIL